MSSEKACHQDACDVWTGVSVGNRVGLGVADARSFRSVGLSHAANLHSAYFLSPTLSTAYRARVGCAS